MSPARWVLVAMWCAGCREAGEFTVTFDIDPPTTGTALIYALPEESGPCTCGECWAACDEGCVRADAGARVDVTELDGTTLAPPPGSWRLVVDFFDATDLLTHSADGAIAIDSDGTSSATIELKVSACPR